MEGQGEYGFVGGAGLSSAAYNILQSRRRTEASMRMTKHAGLCPSTRSSFFTQFLIEAWILSHDAPGGKLPFVPAPEVSLVCRKVRSCEDEQLAAKSVCFDGVPIMSNNAKAYGEAIDLSFHVHNRVSKSNGLYRRPHIVNADHLGAV